LEERQKNAAPLPVSPEKKIKQPEKPVEKKPEASNNAMLKKEIDLAEQQINELEIKKEELEKEMALPNVYGDFAKLQTYKLNYEKVKTDLAAVTQKWESLVERL
jgi:hypothetical protein